MFRILLLYALNSTSKIYGCIEEWEERSIVDATENRCFFIIIFSVLRMSLIFFLVCLIFFVLYVDQNIGIGEVFKPAKFGQCSWTSYRAEYMCQGEIWRGNHGWRQTLHGIFMLISYMVWISINCVFSSLVKKFAKFPVTWTLRMDKFVCTCWVWTLIAPFWSCY